MKSTTKKVLKLTGDAYMKAIAPNGERADCTVRAMSKAFDIPYEVAHKFLSKNGREPRKGIYFSGVIGKKPRILFGKRIAYHRSKGTVASFLKKHPKGTYIVAVTRHVFAVKDGVILGRENINKYVKAYYYISNSNRNDSSFGNEKLDYASPICEETQSIKAGSSQLDCQKEGAGIGLEDSRRLGIGSD